MAGKAHYIRVAVFDYAIAHRTQKFRQRIVKLDYRSRVKKRWVVHMFGKGVRGRRAPP